MVNVPAGTYNVGKDPEGTNQSAKQAVDLNEFWIDQYPVTHLEFQQYTAEWLVPPGKENHPAMGVTWEQADAYCRAANKRLPTEAEWEAAARGPGADPQLYPWGGDAAQALQLPNDTYEVGSQSFNVSPLGVYDMFGNVYEWVGDPSGNLAAGKRLLRGVRYSLPYDLAFRLEVAPTDSNYIQHAGFRCAASQVSE
jgi:formylglycine-generating enzyme required for sulfatase activity